MKICKRICLVFSIVPVLAASAAAQDLWCGGLRQGDVLHGRAPGFAKAVSGGQTYMIDEDGNFLMAFAREAEKQQELQLVTADGAVKTAALKVLPVEWDVQDIKGVPQKKVTPSAANQAAIDDERRQVRGALAEDLRKAYWKTGFMQPVSGRISGKFGGQRIMNGRKMNPHAGTDIAAPLGTPVAAAGDGKVVLTADDLFYSGNVVVIDHGYGLQTIYAHLNKITAQKGQKVKKGEIIGEVGKTGRVTGPHLHWGASLKGIRFNPFSLLRLGGSETPVCFNPPSFTN